MKKYEYLLLLNFLHNIRSFMKINKNLDDDYLPAIKNISFKPIFIMGFHRSGTSILYKMLASTKKFNIVTAYHVLKYDELLYNKFNDLEEKAICDLEAIFKNKGINSRKIDSLEITPTFAQEYVYLLTKKKSNNRITLKNLDLIKEMCKKILYISGNEKPIILKNPYDFSNFIFIKKMLPESKFIFIHRNPINVISSNMQAWNVLLKEKNPYTALFSYHYDQIFKNPLLLYINRVYYSSLLPIGVFSIINRISKDAKNYLKNIDSLEKKDYISITYESLCNDPNKTIFEITKFLNIDSYKIDFNDFIKIRENNLTPYVKIFSKILFKKMQPYFKEFGYKVL